VTRKLLITRLVRCQSCRILYRIPTDPPNMADRLYQTEYDAGFFSDVPSPQELAEMVRRKFAGAQRDYRPYLEVLRALGAKTGSRVLEFGASWGYGVWQLRDAGLDVIGYELSKPRARYAREMLSLPVEDNPDRLPGPLDFFFSTHVLEHLPVPSEAFQLARRLLKPDGLFVAFTPNGSMQRFRLAPKDYQANWGMYHPIYLDEEYYSRHFGEAPFLLCSSPYDPQPLRAWDPQSRSILGLEGSELLFAAALGGGPGKPVK
jgi:SAM-dependent methyltransferase